MPRPRKRGANKLKRIPWKIIRKHNRHRQPSSLEKKVYGWLEEDNISFKKEKAIGRHIHVDIFLEPKTCIELQGCYYHRHKNCYTKQDSRTDLIRNKDAKRIAYLRNQGYVVILIWECEVQKEPEKVRAILRGLSE